jgi:hypothetical protein
MKSAMAEARSDLLLSKVKGYDTGHLQSERERYERQYLICSVTSWDLRDSLRSRSRCKEDCRCTRSGTLARFLASSIALKPLNSQKFDKPLANAASAEQDQAVNEYLKSEFRYHGMKRFVLKVSRLFPETGTSNSAYLKRKVTQEQPANAPPPPFSIVSEPKRIIKLLKVFTVPLMLINNCGFNSTSTTTTQNLSHRQGQRWAYHSHTKSKRPLNISTTSHPLS